MVFDDGKPGNQQNKKKVLRYFSNKPFSNFWLKRNYAPNFDLKFKKKKIGVIGMETRTIYTNTVKFHEKHAYFI